MLCTSPQEVPKTPWAQEGPQSDTHDLLGHWWECPGDPSVGEGPRCLERLPPMETRSDEDKSMSNE